MGTSRHSGSALKTKALLNASKEVGLAANKEKTSMYVHISSSEWKTIIM
jgi:hypothetical protein